MYKCQDCLKVDADKFERLLPVSGKCQCGKGGPVAYWPLKETATVLKTVSKTFSISQDGVRAAFQPYLDAAGVPVDAVVKIIVEVPGGADYSNEELEIGELANSVLKIYADWSVTE